MSYYDDIEEPRMLACPDDEDPPVFRAEARLREDIRKHQITLWPRLQAVCACSDPQEEQDFVEDLTPTDLDYLEELGSLALKDLSHLLDHPRKFYNACDDGTIFTLRSGIANTARILRMAGRPTLASQADDTDFLTSLMIGNPRS